MAGEIKIGTPSNLDFTNFQQNSPENIEKTKSIFPVARPTVAVFDDFSNKIVPIDQYDMEADMSHGEAVEKQIVSQCPNVNIERKGKLIPSTQEENNQILAFTKNLVEHGTPEEKTLFSNQAKAILVNQNMFKAMQFNMSRDLGNLYQEIDKGKNYDAINFSKGATVKIEDLSKVTGLPLTRDNLDKYKDEVRKWLKQNNSNSIKEVNTTLESIEKITAKGVPFYVGAGNDGANSVNLYSFAHGATTVGALQNFQNKNAAEATAYSADNSLVTRWEQGNIPINKVKNAEGEDGFDINQDGKPDILKKDTTSNFSLLSLFKKNEEISGTSFSTPTALGKDLRKKYKDTCGP